MKIHSRMILTLLLIPLVVSPGQEVLNVNTAIAWPVPGHHFQMEKGFITWTNKQIYSEQSLRYSSSGTLRSVFPLQRQSIGLIEANGENYTVKVLNRDFQLTRRVQVPVPPDRGFPRVTLHPDGTLFLLEPVEQKIGISEQSDSLRWEILERRDSDHEKQLFVTALNNTLFILNTPMAGPNNREINIYDWRKNQKPRLIDKIPLSLPYFFFPSGHRLVIIGSLFTDHDSPDNQIIMYDPSQSGGFSTFPLPAIPNLYRVTSQNIYLLFNDRVYKMDTTGQKLAAWDFPSLVPLDMAISGDSVYVLGGANPRYTQNEIVYNRLRLIRISPAMQTFSLATDEPIHAGNIDMDSHRIVLLSLTHQLYFNIPD